MEPLSIWAFTLIAAALGIGFTVAGKKKSGGCCSTPKVDPVVKVVIKSEAERHPGAKGRGITESRVESLFDAEKEKAIDDLIADKN